jgi:hypothetical protein
MPQSQDAFDRLGRNDSDDAPNAGEVAGIVTQQFDRPNVRFDKTHIRKLEVMT